MNQNIRSVLLVLVASVPSLGAEVPVPERLKPLAYILGVWEGDVEMRVTQEGSTKVLRYGKTTTCRIGADGQSLLMEDKEINPWTGKQAATTSVIRHDARSSRYKAMVWDSEGAVRLFLLEAADSKIDFAQVDCGEETALSSTVSANDAGFDEVGVLAATGNNAYRVEWKIRYRRPESPSKQRINAAEGEASAGAPLSSANSTSADPGR